MTLEEIKPYSQNIINDYVNNHISTYQIAKQYNCWSSTIVNLLNELNIPRRNYIEASTSKYQINEEFFDNIDTEEKAYILGFLFADGNNNPANRLTSLRLRLDDRKIIEQIRLAMHSNAPLKILEGCKTANGYQSMPQISFVITNAHIRNRLIELGVTPNKTYYSSLPFDKIPDNLMGHFIRGVFDGDGSIYALQNGSPAIEIVGCYNFVSSIKDYLNSKGVVCLSEQFKSKKADEKIGRIYIYKKDVSKAFLDYIYKDATIYLERKYDRYYNYFYNKLPIEKYSKMTTEEMLNEYGYEDVIPQYDDDKNII